MLLTVTIATQSIQRLWFEPMSGPEIDGKKHGKALQSNPNDALGKYILRELLEIKSNQLCTMEDLRSKGIDSVFLQKHADYLFSLSFARCGAFEKFKDLYS